PLHPADLAADGGAGVDRDGCGCRGSRSAGPRAARLEHRPDLPPLAAGWAPEQRLHHKAAGERRELEPVVDLLPPAAPPPPDDLPPSAGEQRERLTAED